MDSSKLPLIIVSTGGIITTLCYGIYLQKRYYTTSNYNRNNNNNENEDIIVSENDDNNNNNNNNNNNEDKIDINWIDVNANYRSQPLKRLQKDKKFINRIKRVYKTMGYLTGGLGITILSGYLTSKLDIMKEMKTNPNKFRYFVLLTGIASFMSLFSTLSTPKKYKLIKILSWLIFNISQGSSLSTLSLIPDLPIKSLIVNTGVIVSSLSAVSIAAPNRFFLGYGGILNTGLSLLLIGNLFDDLNLINFKNMNLFGGLMIFAGYILYDTSIIFHNAEVLPEEHYDPINESLSLYLDSLNIFIRLVQLWLIFKKKEEEEEGDDDKE
eukprot:TRINITY_DN221_c4_g1_i1.p1 TRINITY_DN221_c4_g1~~TRINITY_DN221_c4_g1_i1.p1  ORF type:complete len:325 (-),score=67.92 TRINITY_DN221_c4_g1_i1:253-1227(-)